MKDEIIITHGNTRFGDITLKDALKVFATKKDIEHCATKKDLESFATKKDLERCATKKDLERYATKMDLERFATKDDLVALEARMDTKFATKKDLDRFATKADLNELKDEVKMLKGEFKVLCEAVINGFNKIYSLFDSEKDATISRFNSVHNRVDDIADRYTPRSEHDKLDKRVGKLEAGLAV